jgi:hypothetical protein
MEVDASGALVFGTNLNGIYSGSGSLPLATTITQASNNLTFSTTGDANTLQVDATNGRVGVDIAAPLEPMHVSGNARVDGRVLVESDSGFERTGVNEVSVIEGGTPTTTGAVMRVRNLKFYDNNNGTSTAFPIIDCANSTTLTLYSLVNINLKASNIDLSTQDTVFNTGNMVLTIGYKGTNQVVFEQDTSSGLGSERYDVATGGTGGTERRGTVYNYTEGSTPAGGVDSSAHNITATDNTTTNGSLTGLEIDVEQGTNVTKTRHGIKSNGNINFSGLPTSSAGLSSGDLWNDTGTIKIV